MFIKQVFYGVMRYMDFLKVFSDKFISLNKATTERKDETLYQIFAYLTIFRLDELPMDDFKHFVSVSFFIFKILCLKSLICQIYNNKTNIITSLEPRLPQNERNFQVFI